MLISNSIFLFWDSTRVAWHDSKFKKLLIYLILALYAAPQFSLCLKQAVLAPVSLRLPSRWAHSVLIGQLLEADSQETCAGSGGYVKQTIVVRFHNFFSFFTRNVNFSNTSVHVRAEIWSEIWEWTMQTAHGKTLAITLATKAIEAQGRKKRCKRSVQAWILPCREHMFTEHTFTSSFGTQTMFSIDIQHHNNI